MNTKRGTGKQLEGEMNAKVNHLHELSKKKVAAQAALFTSWSRV
jgi:hypothetical protein